MGSSTVARSLFVLIASVAVVGACTNERLRPSGADRVTPGDRPPRDDDGDGNDDDDDDEDLCTATPNKARRQHAFVYYGTARPTYVPLTDGQIQAVGTFHSCSGTFITDQWVLTADHCGVTTNDEFCIGVQPGNPNVCFDVAEVHSHPQGDLTVVRVDGSASAELSGTQPIPIFLDSLAGFEGRTAEAAGYGQQEDGGYGEREFSAEPIADVAGDEVTIDGQGTRGVCFGDSGGPVMVIADDGTVRVAGALSWGDPDCLGRDRYTRVDSYRDWVLSFIGEVPDPVEPPAPECGGAASAFGRCDGETLVWCAEGVVVERPCDTCGGDTCGLLDTASGFACLDASCADLPAGGQCTGTVLTSCAGGSRVSADCAASGDICDLNADGAASCLAPTDCGSLDYLGRCDGETAVWCNEQGQRQSLDCATRGESCEYIDDQYGWYCR
ncbi:MAG: trypsin-like serine protease [Deltaproteobacteria bacterium]|nr:trypsin-like serine protease [Deltaproteobacteria bacterium]